MNCLMGYNPLVAKEVKITTWIKEFDGESPVYPSFPNDGDCFVVFATDEDALTHNALSKKTYTNGDWADAEGGGGGGGGTGEVDVEYQVIPDTTFIGERSEYMPTLIYFEIPANLSLSGTPYIVPHTSIDIIFDGVSYSLPWWHDDDHYVEGWGEFEYDAENYVKVPIFTNYPVALHSDFTGGLVPDTNQHVIKSEIIDYGTPVTVYRGEGNEYTYFYNENGYGVAKSKISKGGSVAFAIQNMNIMLGTIESEDEG